MPSGGLTELAALAQDGGWIFPLRGNEDAPLFGVREGGEVTETICIRSEKEVIVARLLTEDWLNAQRGGLRWVLWHFTGSLADAIGELRTLPPHGAPKAPRLRIAAPSQLWTPETR
ncbi:hypothetical protein LFM09_03465 [Lentzea alba]|uniref:hypothetical protein n=1 Tax=Lentzea alba TaxID=2714351 RepID=UPI0039BF605E